MNEPVLLDQYGHPIRREVLKETFAAPSITGVRSPISGYPGNGLDPRRLASLLREADQGDPLRYFELAEQIEERDPHYVGILSTRKRSVAQLDITIEAADDTPEAKLHADTIEAWLGRDELQAELFDMLDAIGKGISFTEIMWDTSEGQWLPTRLEWRDPRWFRFDRNDLTTPRLISETGDIALEPAKFIVAVIKAKSGLPVRAGLARLATWSWMFKAFTLRDWSIFTQTFGQPVRVGQYPPGTTEADKDTLFRAVANIAGDCAAIIPETMKIEFVEAANVGASHALYKERADWLDQQMSKAVLGQTATTDAIAGGHAVGQEHRQVQEDIERADAKALAAILNRDLVRNWIQLEFGPQKNYPRIRIGREDSEDLKTLAENIARLVPLGLQVEKSWASDKFGIPAPAPGAELLTAPASPSYFQPSYQSMHAMQPRHVADPISALAVQAEQLCAPGTDEIFGAIRAIVDRCTSLHQVRDELMREQPNLPKDQLAKLLQAALVIANLTGRANLHDA